MDDRRRAYRNLLIFLAVALTGRVILSTILPLTDFSEARYAEIARKILVSGDWVTLWFKPDMPFWGKPPLAFWSVAASFAAFGVGEFTARLPSLVFTLATAWVLFAWIGKHWTERAGLVAAMVYLGSFLVLQTAGAVITDPLLVLTTAVVMVCFYDAVNDGSRRAAWIMWIALGAGLMAKGPLALALSGLACASWVIIYNRWRDFFANARLFSGILLMLAVAAPWYYLAERATPGFFDYFIVGEHIQRYLETEWSGDKYGGVKDQPFGMIWVYFLAATLPWSLLAIVRLASRRTRRAIAQQYRDEKQILGYLVCWMIVPLLFFTPARNILVTYAMPAIPATAAILATRFESLLSPRGYVHVIATVGAVVFFAGFATAWYLLYENHRYNQKPIIEAYQRMNEKDPGPLIYTGAYRFSAVFYTRDNVVFSARPSSHYIDDTFYVAVRDMWKEGMKNSFGGRCTEEFRHNEFSLWHCPAIQ